MIGRVVDYDEIEEQVAEKLRSVLKFHGIKRNGRDGTGETTGSPKALVESKFKAGWRSLTVKRDGEIVGEITKRADSTRFRTWWAESE